jgi:hypothetical protein
MYLATNSDIVRAVEPERKVVKRPGPTREALYQSPVPRKTHYMPPAVTAWVHAIADGTAARGTIEVLALIEPFSGVMPIWSESVITIAAWDIMCGSPSRH